MADGGRVVLAQHTDDRLARLLSVLEKTRCNPRTDARADAERLLRYADKAREHLAAGNRQRCRDAVGVIRRIATRYGATAITNYDLRGMVIGLEFPPGTYRSGHRNWFFLA